MTTPRTLAEAQAQCRALGTDLRKSGAHMSECVELLAPFCPNGVASTFGVELPTCAGAAPSPRQAAALLKEAEANAAKANGPPWLLIGGGVVVAGLAFWLWNRKG
jgi:hypothetical protein